MTHQQTSRTPSSSLPITPVPIDKASLSLQTQGGAAVEEAERTGGSLQLSTAQPELRREEWDFTKLAGEDVLNCWKWEFQREIYRTNENVRLAVDALRKGRPLNAQALHEDPSNKETAFPWLVEGLAHYPQSVWPETPYQCVDPVYRRLVLGGLKEDDPRRFVATVGRAQDQPLQQCSLEAVVKSPGCFGNWAHWPEGAVLDSGVGALNLIGSAIHREPIQIQCTVVAFSMDWSRTDIEMKASFAQFLQAHRGTSRVLPNPERRGREKSESLLRTELKALGALRLWRHCGSLEKAMRFVQKSRPSLTIYQNERDWCVAKQRVEKLTEHLFEVEESYFHQILGIPREPVVKRFSFQHMGK